LEWSWGNQYNKSITILLIQMGFGMVLGKPV